MTFFGFNSRPIGARSSWPRRLANLLEGLLLVLLAIQLARLVWAILAPTGPMGDWQPRSPQIPGAQARQALFAAFDPFYRIAPSGGDVQQVTSLPVQLYGIRLNEGSGLGSAIIADETGEQRSYAVGDEIAPGVTLKSVFYDHVVIERGGVAETLYIDQSSSGSGSSAPDGTPGDAVIDPQLPALGRVAPSIDGPMSPEALAGAVDMTPRLEKGAVTGIVVSPNGNDEAFARAGFQPGDIVVQVNGTPIRGASDIASLRKALVPGARITLMVERGASTVPIAIILPGNS